MLLNQIEDAIEILQSSNILWQNWKLLSESENRSFSSSKVRRKCYNAKMKATHDE